MLINFTTSEAQSQGSVNERVREEGKNGRRWKGWVEEGEMKGWGGIEDQSRRRGRGTKQAQGSKVLKEEEWKGEDEGSLYLDHPNGTLVCRSYHSIYSTPLDAPIVTMGID